MILLFHDFMFSGFSRWREIHTSHLELPKKSIIVLLAANHAIVNTQWGAFSFTKKLAWETFFCEWNAHEILKEVTDF